MASNTYAQNQLKYNAGEILTWALDQYDIVALDHTTETNQFLIPREVRHRYPIIYNTNVFSLIK